MPSLFGTDVAVNPQLRDVSRSFNGKTVRHYEVDFDVDVSGSVGPDGALRRSFDAIAERCTPIMISATYDSGTKIDVFVEGDFPSDDYNGDGSDQTFASNLQEQIRALGTVDSIDLGSTTVAENGASPYFADDVVADY